MADPRANREQHYVPTDVIVRPGSTVHRMLATFQTREGWKINLYLTKDIERQLKEALFA